MKVKTKLAKQRQAAHQVADIMVACLRKLPEHEQKISVKAIDKLKVTRTGTRKSAKLSSTQVNSRARSQAVVAQQKGVRRKS